MCPTSQNMKILGMSAIQILKILKTEFLMDLKVFKKFNRAPTL